VGQAEDGEVVPVGCGDQGFEGFADFGGAVVVNLELSWGALVLLVARFGWSGWWRTR
jgi:hypothetical protein